MKKVIFDYNGNKNTKLLETRGVSFEDVIAVLNGKGCLAIIDHPNPSKYPNQKIHVIDIDGYVYLVPFERFDNKCVLKTIYPSRKMTRLYRDKLLRGKIR